MKVICAKIDSMEQLPVGTPVRVDDKFGIVKKCEIRKAVPCGLIAVHTIEYVCKRVRNFGQNYSYVALAKKEVSTTNYSFILVLDELPAYKEAKPKVKAK
jgi:hypothetical protein